MSAVSLRALLARSLDYAGMFPPCSLALEQALQNHSQYVRAADSWMLSTFVLPVGQFDAVDKGFSQFDKAHPLRLSALGPKTDSTDKFSGALETITEKVQSFLRSHPDLVSINQLEMPLPGDANLTAFKMARKLVDSLDLQVFWEVPPERAERTISLLAELNEARFGYKLRTGGVTSDTFPSAAHIAKALVAAAKYQVPIKFTAGLHHPVRQFREEVQTKMFGFLNVLGAGVMAAEHGWDERTTSTMLEDEDVSSFLFDDNSFRWREWTIPADRLERRRKLVTSFGSCSFDEPREDLRSLGLL
jgi:hypothetical protein